ncbi:hypothetical protein KA005_07860, partial [bacterium]|nr:hypothetical protein [bacterium]
AGLGAAVAGAGALGAGIGYLAKEAAQLGPIEDSFKAIAKAGGESSEDLMDSFRKQSAGLISNTDLMKSYNKASSLVSNEFANTLPEAMQYLGRVSASTGEDMGYMMNSIVTGVGRMSPMILDNLGIQVDMTAATEAYALILGKSVDEMTKTEKQTGLMNQVMEKLKENTKDMPDIRHPFKQLSVTMVNLKDKMAKALGPAVLHLIQNFADKITAFVESDQFQEWLEETTEWLQVNIPIAIEKVSEYWTNTLLPAIKVVWAWMRDSLFPTLQVLYEWLKIKIPVVIEFLKKAWFKLKERVGEWADRIKEFIAWLRQAWEEDFLGLRTFIEGTFDAIETATGLWNLAMEGKWYEFGETLRSVFEEMGATLRASYDKFNEDFIAWIAGIGKTLRETDWLALGIEIAIGIGEGLLSMTTWLTDTAADICNAIIDVFRGFFGMGPRDNSELKKIFMPIMELAGATAGTQSPGIGVGGYQHGGSFMVGGPPGIDQTPVSFMA